jgi:hypothetical protein
MVAFEALCPREMALLRRGGPELRALVLAELPPWDAVLPDPDPSPWILKHLLAALCERPDLQLTGHDLSKGVGADRYRLPHYLLLAAVRADEKDFSIAYRPWLYLDLRRETARIGCELIRHEDPEEPRPLPEVVELIAVRVEATRTQDTGLALPAEPGGPAGRARAAIKPEYSEPLLRAWFKMRIFGWPKEHAPPTRDQCVAEAREHFGRRIPRDTVRRIRREVAPPSWNKPGKRRSPK